MKKTVLAFSFLAGLSMGLPVHAYEQGDLLVRFGLVTQQPDEESGPVLSGFPQTDSLEVNSDTQPGFSFTYMVADSLGLELDMALPFKHNFMGDGTLQLAGLRQIGEAKLFTPSLLLNWYLPEIGAVQPYLGFGGNYTYFYEEDVNDRVVAPAMGVSSMDLDASSSNGGVVKLGVDVEVETGWALNLSVSRVNMDTKIKVLAEGVQVPGMRRIKLSVDPVVWSVGVVRRF